MIVGWHWPSSLDQFVLLLGQFRFAPDTIPALHSYPICRSSFTLSLSITHMLFLFTTVCATLTLGKKSATVLSIYYALRYE